MRGSLSHAVQVYTKFTLPPGLSQKGQLQALGVPSTYSVFFTSLDYKTTVILTSPFRRCMQTTLAAFASVLPPVAINPTPLTILPQLQECGKEPCDTGSELESTKAMFPQGKLSLCDARKSKLTLYSFRLPRLEQLHRRLELERGLLRSDRGEAARAGQVGAQVVAGLQGGEGGRCVPSRLPAEAHQDASTRRFVA